MRKLQQARYGGWFRQFRKQISFCQQDRKTIFIRKCEKVRVRPTKTNLRESSNKPSNHGPAGIMFIFSQFPFSTGLMNFFNGGIIPLNISLKSTKTHTLNIIKTQDIILQLKRQNPTIL